MTDQIRTFTDEDTSQFGGDYAITRTIPRVHPRLGIKMKGTRDSIEGADVQYHSFFRGDIWNKDNREGDYNFAIWRKDNSSTAELQESHRNWMRLTISGGFKPCLFSEWEVSEPLQAIYTDKDGLLVQTGGADGLLSGGISCYDVVMWRPASRLLEEEAKRVNQTTPEALNAEAQKRISGAITDNGVAAMPTQVTEVAHRYVPTDAEPEA